jgi:asparagine synthase (glutamine-hydrolysing)
MCGIWFYLKRIQSKLTNEDLNNYMKCFLKIKNRGPDITVIKKINYNGGIRAIAGFHRLAIMDTSSNGNQPFYYADVQNEILVICNGEIYNHLELIKEHNLHPKSHSDCEVIMELYKKYGDVDKIVRILNGEFAFVIFHREIEKGKVNVYASTDPISVRPLFIGYIEKKFEQSDIFFCSELKGLECCDRVERFKPGYIFKISYEDKFTHRIHSEKDTDIKYYPYYTYDYTLKVKDDIITIYQQIVDRLSNSVLKRIQSDRPLGCLLSGGLDSSLVACLLAKHMYKIDSTKTVTFFSIGNSDAPDVVNAIKVYEHIKKNINSNIKHVIFDISFGEALKIIPDVIKAIETYDITTIRASTWQYLLAKNISETSDIKVILNGDGADEIEMGYQYFKNAPTPIEAQLETEKLLKDIHLYDCLRVDRAVSFHGLEARVPFLDLEFFDYYMKIEPELKIPTNGIEKYLIRKAFEVIEPNLLCHEVLWRKKEAFSDGVSHHIKSWFEIIQDKVEEIITDDEYTKNKNNYAGVQPVSKESYYYRKIYESHYKSREDVIKYYWLPNWSGNITEPSARVLKVYEN